MTIPSSSGRQKQTGPPLRKTQPVATPKSGPAPAATSGRAPKQAHATGEHAPLKSPSGRASITGEQRRVTAAPNTPRQNTSDRQGGGAAGNAKPRAAKRGGPRIALRMKFMLVMAGVTAVAMIVLGLSMGRTANNYLYGQKTLDGIETARMAAQLANIVRDRVVHLQGLAEKTGDRTVFANLQGEIQRQLKGYLEEARTWGGGTTNSDIEGILFNCPDIPELSGAGIGSDNGTYIGDTVHSIFIPKRNATISMPEGVAVYEGRKQTSSGEVKILRFKIDLMPDSPPPRGFGKVMSTTTNKSEPANVRVDIAMASVDEVRSNLAMTITIAIALAIVVVLGIAQWLATSITHPLERLLKDMQIVSKGRLDHRTDANSNDEIGILANEFNKMTSSLQDAQQAVIEQEKQAYELSLAREVQQQLLPAQPPLITGYQCHSFYLGAKAVSGDYFDFIPLGNGLWGFIIADVSGKGIPGSMVMAVTRTVVRLVAPRHGSNAAETLKDTNRLIAKQIKRGMFVTSFYAVLDENTGLVTYASAGHNPMIICRGATRSFELATTKGIALGFNEGPIFDRTIQLAQCQLGHGDSLVLYTDGFPEAMNSKNEEFGDDTFNELVSNNGHLDPPAMVDAVVAGVAKHRGDAEQSDDLTMLTVRRA